jgi:PD-(D/E)XK nuclease family transposase
LQLPFFTKEKHELETQFDKWCYFLKNLETMDAIPAILNEPIFNKAFDVASLSNMDKNDYILYQISKSKKYDMQILSEEIAERSKAEGKAEAKAEFVLMLHDDGYTPPQISGKLKIPIENVVEVLRKQGFTDVN